MKDTWDIFAEEFSALFLARKSGDSFSLTLNINKQALEKILATIWQDTLGYCGVEIIRRIVGLAHVEDLESIADTAERGTKENAAIAFARKLILGRNTIQDIASVL